MDESTFIIRMPEGDRYLHISKSETIGDVIEKIWIKWGVSANDHLWIVEGDEHCQQPLEFVQIEGPMGSAEENVNEKMDEDPAELVEESVYDTMDENKDDKKGNQPLTENGRFKRN